jgi:alkaline phosphatase D
MKNISLFIFLLLTIDISAQNKSLIAGPMIGHTELRSSTVWIESTTAAGWSLKYFEPGVSSSMVNNHPIVEPINENFTLKFVAGNLEPGKTYQYQLLLKGVLVATGNFTTQQLWQWRTAAPDFSFITGSCAYFNQPQYDRPGKPYGGDSSIFETMAKEKADFMLWLGDNWYTREADYSSEWGLNYRASHDRSLKILQPFWKAMPHYAIWDDHDYSWNDGDKSFPLKEASLDIFKKVWCNPSYGENGEATYTKVTWNDVDIFLLDDRWYRSNDQLKDSVDGKPNPNKKMFGDKQMEWMKNSLIGSKGNTNINFRIIATGSQVLNPLSPFDCMRHYPVEFYELLNFIRDNNISDVVFLTGDRHHSEIIKADRPGFYPLYDITSSPLTSGVAKTFGSEKDNPARVIPEIDEQNYTRFTFSGRKPDRKMTVEFIGIKGQKLGEWTVTQKEISIPR